MSPRRLIQILTGVVLVLLGAIGFLVYYLGSQPPPQTVITTVTNTVKQIAVRKFNATNMFGEGFRLSWSNIESTNYQTYIANLRGIGCPEETVRDIIITDISKL